MGAVVNMRGWFRDDELDPCPRCKRQTAITAPDTGFVVCIECGVVGVHAEPGAAGTQPS